MFSMSRFLFPLSLVLVFNSSSHLVMSKSESQVAPRRHHSSQIVNFSSGTSQPNVAKQHNSSSSYSLSQLQPSFQTPSLSSLASNNESSSRKRGRYTGQHPTIRSQQTSGNNGSGDGGHGRENFNDNFVSTPADFMSQPQASTQMSRHRRGEVVPVPSLRSSLVSDTTRKAEQLRRTRKIRSLSTIKPTNGGILQTSNSNLSFVQDKENLVLKLDRNYTPKDIAEYIVSTGDERGIIQVVADMMQDGQLMASRDDVILFLETVQRELNKLKSLNQLHRPSLPPA